MDRGLVAVPALRVRFGKCDLCRDGLTATSIAITANVLKELGKLQTDAAKAIIGAAVIDDVLGLLALAISTDVVSGSFSVCGVLIVQSKRLHSS